MARKLGTLAEAGSFRIRKVISGRNHHSGNAFHVECAVSRWEYGTQTIATLCKKQGHSPQERRMNRKLVLGVLIALSATAAVQPAAAQWSDRWDRGGGFGISVGFGSPGYDDYAYTGYGAGCTCARAPYGSAGVRRYPSYSGYAYADSPYADYGYSRYSYSDYTYDDDYPGYGYASVGIGVTDRSRRGLRYRGYMDTAGYAGRDRDFDRRSTVRARTAARSNFVDTDSRTRFQARGETSRRDVQGTVHASEGMRERSATVRSGGSLEDRAPAGATEGRASGARAGARIEGGAGARPMRGNAGETR
jgi:hypothetical protein